MPDGPRRPRARPAAPTEVTAQTPPEVPSGMGGAGSLPEHQTVGPYKILQVLGEGGFGVVYMAEQGGPVHRRVAVKVLKAGMDSKSVLGRFEAERQALAMMDHPNIAQVFGAGMSADGRPYFAMELVRGLPVHRFCDQENLSTRERLELFIAICQAVQHAHQKGIIHRDLKPGNVIVALHDGKPVPKVIDFGIAKALHQPLTERTLVTHIGQLIGTPEYMSPEQAESSGLDVDTRTDIYSLGVMLYELLTGTLPLESAVLRSGDIGRNIREKEAPLPSTRITTAKDLSDLARHRATDIQSLKKQLRGDLDWVTMKAMAKDRKMRYETANALAMDIQRHLRNEPVLAGPPSVRYRVSKFVRRHRVGVAATTAVVLALLIGLGAAVRGFVEARRANANLSGALTATEQARDEARAQKRQADSARDAAKRAQSQAESLLYTTTLSAAVSDLTNNNPSACRTRLEHIPEAMRAWEWRYLWASADQSTATPLDFSEEGRSLGLEFAAVLSAEGSLAASRLDSVKAPVVVRDVVSGQVMLRQDLPEAPLFHMGFSTANRLLMVTMMDSKGTLLIDLKTGKQLLPGPLQRDTFVAAVDEGAGRVVLGRGGRSNAKICSLSDFHELCTLGGAEDRNLLQSAAFSPDGSLLAAGFNGGRFTVFDTKSGAPVWRFPTFQGRVSAVGWSDDGQYVACYQDEGGLIQLIRTSPWENMRTISHRLPSGSARLAFARTSAGLAVVAPSAIGGRLYAWPQDGGPRIEWLGHETWITGMAFSAAADQSNEAPGPDEQWMITVSRDGVVKRWDLTRAPPIRNGGNSIAFSGDGALLAVGEQATPDDPTAVRLYEPATMRPLGGIEFVPPTFGYTFPSSGLFLSEDGLRISMVGSCGTPPVSRLKVFDLGAGVTRHLTSPGRPAEGRLHPGEIHACMSPDGRTMVTGGTDNAVRFWSTETHQQISELKIPYEGRQVSGGIIFARFSPDGRLLFAYPDSVGHLFDAGSKRKLAVLREHTGEIQCDLFTPDGRFLVTASVDRTCRVWPVPDPSAPSAGAPAELKSVAVLRGHAAALWSLAFSPDGSRLATGSDDRTIKIWDTATWSELATIPMTGSVRSLVFSPDGTRLLAWSGELRVLDTVPEPQRSEERRRGVAAERVATPYVSQLFERGSDAVAVRDQIRKDPSLSAPVRQAAQNLVTRRLLEDRLQVRKEARDRSYSVFARRLLERCLVTEARAVPMDEPIEAMNADPSLSPVQKEITAEYLGARGLSVQNESEPGLDSEKVAWDVVYRAFRHPGQVAKARVLAEAVASRYDRAFAHLVLGAARYRDGDTGGALESLGHSDELRAAESKTPYWETTAYTALCLAASGDTAAARPLLDTMVDSFEIRTEEQNCTAGLLYAEVAYAIGGRPLMEETVSRVSAKAGSNSQALFMCCMGSIARLLQDGELSAAVEFSRNHFEVFGPQLPAENIYMSWLLNWRAVLALEQGNAEEAERLAREALRVRLVLSSRIHGVTAECEITLGRALAGLKRYAEAEPLLVHGQECFLSHSLGNAYRVREGLLGLVSLYEAWGKPDKAAHWRAILEEYPKPPYR